jgi:hypothetical protein
MKNVRKGIGFAVALLSLTAANAYCHGVGTGGSEILQTEADMVAAALTVPNDLHSGISAGGKGLVAYAFRWPVGATLKVCFMEKDRLLRALIASVASEWMGSGANVHLDFGSNDDPRQCSTTVHSDIRVGDGVPGSLSPYDSQVGNGARYIAEADATMNLGFHGPNGELSGPALAAARKGDTHFPSYFRFVILHEFGHALGFMHEHQWGTCAKFLTPNAAKIVFGSDSPAAKLQLQFLTQANWRDWQLRNTTATEDFESVMRYQFPTGVYTADADPRCANNIHYELSKGDLASIRVFYPQPGDQPALLANAAAQTASSITNDPALKPAAAAALVELRETILPAPSGAPAQSSSKALMPAIGPRPANSRSLAQFLNEHSK